MGVGSEMDKAMPVKLSSTNGSTRQSTRGSSSVEYCVVSAVVIATLFVPLPGLDESLVNTFLMALKQFQSNTTYLMSMP